MSKRRALVEMFTEAGPMGRSSHDRCETGTHWNDAKNQCMKIDAATAGLVSKAHAASAVAHRGSSFAHHPKMSANPKAHAAAGDKHQAAVTAHQKAAGALQKAGFGKLASMHNRAVAHHASAGVSHFGKSGLSHMGEKKAKLEAIYHRAMESIVAEDLNEGRPVKEYRPRRQESVKPRKAMKIVEGVELDVASFRDAAGLTSRFPSLTEACKECKGEGRKGKKGEGIPPEFEKKEAKIGIEAKIGLRKGKKGEDQETPPASIPPEIEAMLGLKKGRKAEFAPEPEPPGEAKVELRKGKKEAKPGIEAKIGLRKGSKTEINPQPDPPGEAKIGLEQQVCPPGTHWCHQKMMCVTDNPDTEAKVCCEKKGKKGKR